MAPTLGYLNQYSIASLFHHYYHHTMWLQVHALEIDLPLAPYSLPFPLPVSFSSHFTFSANHSSHCATVQLELISFLTTPSNTTVGVTWTPTCLDQHIPPYHTSRVLSNLPADSP